MQYYLKTYSSQHPPLVGWAPPSALLSHNSPFVGWAPPSATSYSYPSLSGRGRGGVSNIVAIGNETDKSTSSISLSSFRSSVLITPPILPAAFSVSFIISNCVSGVSFAFLLSVSPVSSVAMALCPVCILKVNFIIYSLSCSKYWFIALSNSTPSTLFTFDRYFIFSLLNKFLKIQANYKCNLIQFHYICKKIM